MTRRLLRPRPISNGMRTTRMWALKRQALYGSLYTVVVLLILGGLYLRYFHDAPTCFDGWKNGGEEGVDCGGSCTRICAFNTYEPDVRWAKSFKVTAGTYNAVGYVENNNQAASTKQLHYTFKLYDESGLITEQSGTTILPPDSVYPVFAAGIDTGSRTPTRTFLELQPIEVWQPSSEGRNAFSITKRNLENVGTKPRLDATIRNDSVKDVQQVEVVATLFNIKGTPLTSSRTIVNDLGAGDSKDIVFTWREPIATTLRSCEIPTDVLLAVDLSGSMNNDGDNPPQPLTDVLGAGVSFVGRLKNGDQAGIITFASDAQIAQGLSPVGSGVGNTLLQLSIAPEEEQGTTNTAAVFKKAVEAFSAANGNPNARKVLVLLTDGLATAPEDKPEETAIQSAAALKRGNITIYTIGLGDKVNMDFLKKLATEPDFAYQAVDSSQVDDIYKTITSGLCESGPTRIDIIPKTDAFFTPLQ